MLEKIKVSIGNEDYLELEGKKLKEEIIREGRDERRRHIDNGLHSQYFIDVIVKKQTWDINSKIITIDVTEEYYKKDKPIITKISDDIMNMLVYDGKSVAEVKELLAVK